jgi:hypothetical protein
MTFPIIVEIVGALQLARGRSRSGKAPVFREVRREGLSVFWGILGGFVERVDQKVAAAI